MSKTVVEGTTVTRTTVVGVQGPEGAQGPTGASGAQGPQGDPGEGVPTGGLTGQLLAKATATDHDTEWIDPPSGLGDVVGPGSAVSGNLVAFDGATGKLVKDALVSSSSFATAAQGALADTATQPGDLGDSAALDVGTTAGTVAAGDHDHAGVYEPADATILKSAAIGVSVQGYDADLAAIAALAKTDGNIIVGNGTAWVAESGATARASLGLGSAAVEAASAFATSAQGSLADSAVQPGDLASVATSGAYGDLSGTPTLGTAAALNVPAAGDAATGEVVKGSDSRLSDARTPTSHSHTLSDITDAGTAAAAATGDFATAAQGSLADTAVQPGDPVSINAQTGTSYTLVLGDAGTLVTSDNGSAVAFTIPTNGTVAFDVGTVIAVAQLGAGTLTIQGDTGVTVNGVSAGSEALSAQYATASLVKVATDTWLVAGGLA